MRAVAFVPTPTRRARVLPVSVIALNAFASPHAAAGEAFEARIAEGRWDLALEGLEKLLEGPGSKELARDRELRLRKLRARCLFELGDYPACERELRAVFERAAGEGPGERVECLAQLAKALALQDLGDAALAAIDEARRLRDAPALRRLAIVVCLRSRRFSEILPHAEALLAEDPRDPYAHFVRGIALSEAGRLEESLDELARGLEVPGAARDARFQMALVLGRLGRPERALEHLVEIVEGDPYDGEACYQASQQLARLRTPEGREAAKRLRDYFLALEKAQGETAREHPFEAAGRAAFAALLRAARWRRLRVYDRMLAEIRRARAVARGDPEPHISEAEFWASAGLLAEAESTAANLEASRSKPLPEDAAARLRKLREAIGAGRKNLRAQAASPLGAARLAVAEAAWEDARPHLEALLARAAAAKDFACADEAARLLLARDPLSVRALAFLAERTSAPELLPPRLHYLARLARALPDDARFRDRLERARAEFLGKGTAAARSTPRDERP